MASPLPPDPYVALGVPKDVTPAAVKAAHRKLVLKCHPDKVTDPAAKQAAADEFHKIQTAYEILIDEDRRARYDAQVRLASLKREAMERQSASTSRGQDARPTYASYRSSQESNNGRADYPRTTERATPLYEERRPAYAATGYFDVPPRAGARKESREPEYERTPRRSVHEPKEKVRAFTRDPKDVERAGRKEKSKNSQKEMHRERDRKYSNPDGDSDSESDEYDRWQRRQREEDEERKTREAERRAREIYYEQQRRDKEQASSGHFDDRTRKMFLQDAGARDYIQGSRSRHRPDLEHRPSLTRAASTRDRVESVRTSERRPSGLARQHSVRPQTAGRDAEPLRRPPREERERRSSADVVDEPVRPPPLSTSKSSPAEIRLPTDKPRAQSLQPGSEFWPEMPQPKRAETMPYHRSSDAAQTKGTYTRSTEPTSTASPVAAAPEYAGRSPTTKYSYGSQYADDAEYPTPDGYRTADSYRTEYREPTGSARPSLSRKLTRSPSPIRDNRAPRESREPRERARTSSERYGSSVRPPPLPSRTTSYVYQSSAQPGVKLPDRSRPSMPRINTRDTGLFGEISGSPQQQYSPFSPPASESARYTRDIRPENIRTQSGYGYSTNKKTVFERPSNSRGGSVVYAR